MRSFQTRSYITNAYDTVARLVSTKLLNSGGRLLNSHAYVYDALGQRYYVTNTLGDYCGFNYDNIGQLTLAYAFEPNGTARYNEHISYTYDAAGNLGTANRSPLEAFNVNSLNELTNVTRSGFAAVAGTTTSPATNVTVWANGTNFGSATLYGDATWSRLGVTLLNGANVFTAFAQDSYGRTDSNTVTAFLPQTNNYTYDLNGNLLSDGVRNFAYEDENELTSVWVTNAWRSDFVYDGKLRRRIRREFTWSGSSWLQTNEIHYIYDGNLVLQERDTNKLPVVSYTRGRDLGGSLQAAGGIGGLLARTDHHLLTIGDPGAHAFYHADANGNITYLINENQVTVAKYLW